MAEQPHDISEPRREAAEPRQELTFKTDPDGYPVTAVMAKGWIKTVQTIRPGWRAADIAAALDQCRTADPVDACLALIAAARNPLVKNPDVIVRTGVWWDAAAVYPPRPVVVENVVPFPTRRERKREGKSIRDTEAFQRNFQTAKQRAEADAAARGGYRITEGEL